MCFHTADIDKVNDIDNIRCNDALVEISCPHNAIVMGFWTEWLIKNNKKELHSKRDEELRQQQQKATTKLNYFYDQPSGHLEVNRKQNKTPIKVPSCIMFPR